MDNYLILIPIELKFTIIYYLDEYDLIELNEIIDIDYEKLFAFYYPEDYGTLKKLFKQDKYIRKYRNIWEIIYISYPGTSADKSTPFLHSIYQNLKYRINIYKDFPNYYKYLEILDKSFMSEYHAFNLYDLIIDNRLSKFLDLEHVEINNIIDILAEDSHDSSNILLLLYLLLSLGKLDKIHKNELNRFIRNYYEEIAEDEYSDTNNEIYFNEIVGLLRSR